jgi:hypothetical protein
MPRERDPMRSGRTTLVFMVVDEKQPQHRAALTIIYERTVLSIAVVKEKCAKGPYCANHSDVRG